jgi:cytosine/adenosine deaminase-related metal-dependent hydrolase
MDEVAHRLHDGERTWVALAPNSPHSASFELMRGAAQLASRRGLRLHTHLSETAAVVDLYRERFGATPVQVLEDLGWLGSTTWVAHATHLTEEELPSVVRSGMGVSHCPSGNARLGTGMGPVAWLREQGVPVGLGVDGGAVNEASAIMPEMRQALYLARLRAADTAAFSPADALDAATRGGAACLGLDDRFGTLEVGRLADLVVWPAADLLDFPDPVTGLVFGPARRAREVYVDGRAIVRNGAVLRVDVEAAYRNLQRRSQRLRASHSSQ